MTVLARPRILGIPPSTVAAGIRYPRVIPRPDLGGRAFQYVGPQPWVFTVRGVTHEIPIGFVFDGASVPTVTGLAWVVTLPPGDPRVLWAALEHDWLCYLKPPATPYDAAAERFRQVLL